MKRSADECSIREWMRWREIAEECWREQTESQNRDVRHEDLKVGKCCLADSFNVLLRDLLLKHCQSSVRMGSRAFRTQKLGPEKTPKSLAKGAPSSFSCQMQPSATVLLVLAMGALVAMAQPGSAPVRSRLTDPKV